MFTATVVGTTVVDVLNILSQAFPTDAEPPQLMSCTVYFLVHVNCIFYLQAYCHRVTLHIEVGQSLSGVSILLIWTPSKNRGSVPRIMLHPTNAATVFNKHDKAFPNDISGRKLR